MNDPAQSAEDPASVEQLNLDDNEVDQGRWLRVSACAIAPGA
jgi:hypothetical protein